MIDPKLLKAFQPKKLSPMLAAKNEGAEKFRLRKAARDRFKELHEEHLRMQLQNAEKDVN